MQQVKKRRLLTIGEGPIDPLARIARGEITAAEIEDFCERLQTDEFYDEFDSEAIPNSCVDGRGLLVAGPNAAGGSFSLVMGDALTTQTYRQAGEKAPLHARRLFNELTQLGKRVGGHGDTHAREPNCGCGAEDKLDAGAPNAPSILEYITRRPEDIRDFLESLGVVISDELHGRIAATAGSLRAEKYAASGAELRQVTQAIGGEDSAPLLPGDHLEAVLIINNRPAQTLNRQKVHDAYTGRLQAFNLDVPALAYGTSLLAASETEASERLTGALYYNVATAAVLANNLRLVERQ